MVAEDVREAAEGQKWDRRGDPENNAALCWFAEGKTVLRVGI